MGSMVKKQSKRRIDTESHGESHGGLIVEVWIDGKPHHTVAIADPREHYVREFNATSAGHGAVARIPDLDRPQLAIGSDVRIVGPRRIDVGRMYVLKHVGADGELLGFEEGVFTANIGATKKAMFDQQNRWDRSSWLVPCEIFADPSDSA